MSSSLVVHQQSLNVLPVLEAKAWREDLLARLGAGLRPITCYARPLADGQVRIIAVLQASDGTLELLACQASIEHGYHELTSACPALHCFEREMHEQTGLRIAGHPWLKPIRYQGQAQSAMNAYPFYAIEGKEVHEVAVGPIHAGVIEPGSFRFMCLGEQVHHLEIHLGYQHRGVERRLLEGDARRLTPLVETIAGDSSVAHAWAHCAAIEQLAGVTLEPEIEMARAVALELERVAMHLASLSGLAADIAFLQGATTYGRLRTTAINSTMRLCGSRFGRSALRPGGIGMTLPSDILALLRDNVRLMSSDLAIINECFLGALTVQHRLRSTGVLSERQARDLGLVGLAARASGVAIDQRQLAPHGAYRSLPIAPVVLGEGDCWARAHVRILEMDASLDWITSALARHSDWARPKQVIGALPPRQLVVAMAEGWRGEVVHCLETGDSGALVHYKVQDPSLRNWMGLAIAMRKNEISDFPICNKSFDLSYAGNDL